MQAKLGVARPFLLFALAASFCTFAAEPPPRFPQQQITLAEWQAYLDEVTSLPGVVCKDTQRHEVSCVAESLKSVWVFTAPGHPAHPAVSTGVLVVTANAAAILSRGYYAGNESAFYAWVADAYRDVPNLDKWTQAPFNREP
jgi:hypothetical protein